MSGIQEGIRPGLVRAWGDGATSKAKHTIVDTRMRSVEGNYWTECSCGVIIKVNYVTLQSMSRDEAGDLYAEVLAERYAAHVNADRNKEGTRAQLPA